jgi:hypothetical protein
LTWAAGGGALDRPQLLAASGPWPFITRRLYRRADQAPLLWRSRHHRKRLPLRTPGLPLGGYRPLLDCLWMPEALNWWIGLLFALGSLLFASGSLLSLMPLLARTIGLSAAAINALFFLGSIPFTAAAYLQLFQAANASPWPVPARRPPGARHWLGWRPRDPGWLSCALQFPGTLLFNFNTADALGPPAGWLGQEVWIWTPDLLGSILFLASGYLAFIEAGHSHWAWTPSSLSWWVTVTNLLGCVGFMLSALGAVVLPSSLAPGPAFPAFSLLCTLLGGLCFLIGALLLLPEAVLPS